MSERNYLWRIGTPMAVVLATLTVAGCEGVRLHDQTKSELATSIKTRYEAAELLGSVEVQRENLAALSADEMKVVRDNLRLQRDYALLEMVDNDSPMGVTWNEEIEAAIEKLGLDDPAALREYVTGEEIRTEVRGPQMARLIERINKATGVVPPACSASPPLPAADALDWPTDLDQATIERAKRRYQIYFDACQQLLAGLVAPKGGALLRSRKEWEKAAAELDLRSADVAVAKELVKDADRSHAAAVKEAAAAGMKGERLRKAIKESADRIRGNLERASTLAPDVVTGERISAIVTLLKAAAGEETSFDGAATNSGAAAQPNEELAKAVLFVNGVSSLSGDVATLVATARAPSISNLLIELQHQTVLFEHAKARQTLQQERVDILETKYLAYLEEAEVLLTFRDALCSFGHLTDGGTHPGRACDDFTMSADGKTCMASGTELPDCGLEEPWKTHLKSPPKGQAGREFYKGLTAFNRLFPVRATQIEQNFLLIDLKHRENLAAREMALKAWNNLAAVPIDQIEAYYGSGLKPEQIADVIVKALGFTAITVGVSQ